MKPKIKVGETYPDGFGNPILIIYCRTDEYAPFNPFIGLNTNLVTGGACDYYSEYGESSHHKNDNGKYDLILPAPKIRVRPWTYDEIPIDALLTVPPYTVQFKILGKKLTKEGDALIMTPPDVEGITLHSVKYAYENYRYKLPGTEVWRVCGVEEEE